jgi:hypothetical protein
MARRIFFSFHFEKDVWRANQVRMTNVVAGPDVAGFFDHSEYEEAKKKGDDAIKRMIREKLKGTTVTVVLNGRETASRPYVKYEVEQSLAQDNGLVGIHIHQLKMPRDPDYVPLASEIGEVIEELFDWTPPLPLVPKGTDFPAYKWDGDLDRFRREIEAAGKRAERLRSKRSS